MYSVLCCTVQYVHIKIKEDPHDKGPSPSELSRLQYPYHHPHPHHQQQRSSEEDLGSCSPGLHLPLVPPVNPFGSLHFFGLNHLATGGPLDLMRKDEDMHHHHHSILHQQQQHRKERGSPTAGRSGKSAHNNNNNNSGGGGSRGNSMTPDKLRQMGVINADAFCEFCCKEFCNKYFLRVHKLKKHGVCSPELPPEKVQKILQQMAKEAGKTGQPMPPLTLGTPSALGGLGRPSPPSAGLSDPSKSIGGGGGPLGSSPLSLIRPPTLPNFLSLPPLDPLMPPLGGGGGIVNNCSRDPDVYSSSSSSDRVDEREEGRPINFQLSPRSLVMEPDCELRVEESCAATADMKSPLPGEREEEGERRGLAAQYCAAEQAESERRRLQQQQHREQNEDDDVGGSMDPHTKDTTEGNNSSSSEGLANLQNMIMKLNSNKPTTGRVGPSLNLESNTVCKTCNRDMENKYFLHAHMMNEHGVLNMEEEDNNRQQHLQMQQHNSSLAAAVSPAIASPPPPPPPPASVSVSLPQYPADLSKLAESGFRLSGLNIPCPLISSPSPNNGGGLSKLSEKPLDFPKSLFDQLQGLPRHPASFLDQMKRDLGAKMEGGGGVPLGSPLKRPSLDQRDPNKKPASLSRSYCEICKKELCNKYFMKTHMMKMHGIVMDQTAGGGGGGGGHSNSNNGGGNNVNCEVCKKEVSSRYFLKVHMASAHGLNEDGSPIREMGGGGGGLMNLFPSMGDFPPPPPHLPPHMGEFSRLLMQQGEKSSLEQRLKELDRLNKEQQQGHICSLCSRAFTDIVSLQVHIIKSHGALPPTSSLDSLFHHHNSSNNSRKEMELAEEEERSGGRSNNNNNNNTEDATMEEDDDIAEPDAGAAQRDGGGNQQQQPAFPFPLEKSGLELLQRQLTAGSQFPAGMLGPAVLLGSLPGFGGAGQQQHQFQGLFNMFLSEMLKKVQKDTPPQTPPVSPTATPPNSSSSPPTPPAPSTQEAAATSRLGETTTTS